MLSLKRYNKRIGVKYADGLETWFREDYSTDMPLLYVLQGLHCRQESYAAVIIACQKVIEEVRAGVDPEKAKETIRTLVLQGSRSALGARPRQGRARRTARASRYRAGIFDVFKTLFEYAGIDICAPEYEEQTQMAVERLREVRDTLHNEWRTNAGIDRTFRVSNGALQRSL
ncbi:hypothetical protein DFH11DRAFT_1617380 [Phellopilus nigrolimitatus]|nr:hypothetical protein DFH11DRAFT_1617380 [Phellopilus nigrolimitatus]